MSNVEARAYSEIGSSECFNLTTTLNGLGPPGLDGGAHGLFSSDPGVNPDFHNWHHVYAPYCDGGSKIANVKAPIYIKGAPYYFRGAVIVKETIEAMKTLGLSQATELLVEGCSAGGLAVLVTLDQIAAMLPTIRVRGIPTSGDSPHAIQ